MSRSTAASTHTVNLMPLLDVLLCTMGTLIVILGVINREARLHPAKRMAGKAAQQQQELVDAKEDLQLRIQELTASREKTLADLETCRKKLAGVEDTTRELEDHLQALLAAGKELKASHDNDPQRDQLRAQLAQLDAERLQLEKDLQHARMDSAHRQPAYAVVPFEGMYKTNRRPIYIECRNDCVILQPEGIVFQPDDFLGPGGPSNPLASALRAAQEYWRQAPRPAPDLPNEPYPLLLVRPDGIIAYYLVRDAMSSWDAEFGYELVGENWKLDFPMQPEPQLKEQEERAVADARQQLQWLAKISPELFARKSSKVEYHVSPFRGGVVRDGGPSLGDDPFADDPLGGFGRTGVRGGGGGNFSGGGSNQYGGGNPNGDRYGNGGNSANGTLAYGGNVPGGNLGGNSAFGGSASGISGSGPNGSGSGLNSGGMYGGGNGSGPAGNGLVGNGQAGNNGTSNSGSNGSGLNGNGSNGVGSNSGPMLSGPAGGGGPGFPGDQTGGAGGSGYLAGGPGGNGSPPAGGNDASGNNYYSGGGNGGNDANRGTGSENGASSTNGGGPQFDNVGPRYAGARNSGNGFGNGNGGGSNGNSLANSSSGAANGDHGMNGSGSPSEYGGVQLPDSASGPSMSGVASSGSGSGSPGTSGSAGSASATGSAMGSTGGQYAVSTGPLGSSAANGMYGGTASSGSAGSSSGGSGGMSSSSGGDSSSSGGQSSSMFGGSSDPNTPAGAPSMSFDLTPQQQQNAASYDPSTQQSSSSSSSSRSLAKNRGRNWALPNSRTASIPIERPIRVECWPDRLVLVPDTRDQQAQVIPLGERTEDSVDPLVGAIRSYTKSWGIAGRSMYWKPQLVLNVNPNAEARAADLQTLLADSGWNVKRK